MRHFNLSAVCSLLLAILPAAGCSMSTPTQVKTGEIVVADVMSTRNLSASSIDTGDVNIAADDILRNGKRRAALVVPYLRERGHANKLHAVAVGEGYKRAFAQYGVDNLKVDYAETSDRVAARSAVLAYTSTEAQAPRDCTRLTGVTGPEDLKAIEKYQIGCETRTMLAKMIARPEDLMGTDGSPDEMSRRGGPVTEGYMSGRTNAPLTGLNASTTGTTSVTGGGISTGATTTQ